MVALYSGTIYKRPFTKQLPEEDEHLQKVLARCKYPGWALNRVKNKISAPNHQKKTTTTRINQYALVPAPTLTAKETI